MGQSPPPLEACCKQYGYSPNKVSDTVAIDTSLLQQKWAQNQCQKKPAHPLAEQMAQFRLPDDTTPVLTELRGLAPACAMLEASGESEKARGECWTEVLISSVESDHSETTATMSGRSSPTCSMDSDVIGIDAHDDALACAGDNMFSTPSHRGTSDKKMQQAQSLFASMLDPSHVASKNRNTSGRQKSEPPMLPKTTSEPNAKRKSSLVIGKSDHWRQEATQVSLQVQVAGLQPLNGRMPNFPAAELNAVQKSFR